MNDCLLTWAKDHRAGWRRSLKRLRSGVLATFELRGGKRVDTPLETIAEQTRGLAELEAAIDRREFGGG
jgi:hypothetical protein